MNRRRSVVVILGMGVLFLVVGWLGFLPDGDPRLQAQGKKPPDLLGLYLNAFHFHNGDMGTQMEIHHYCGPVSEELTQCALYDARSEGARLVGVEYVISEKAFKGLPDDEKKMWHSHVYEVKSGQLIAPDLSVQAEHDLLKNLISTYGKTFHTWDTHHWDSRLPLGVPSLMMAFTADGQAHAAMVEKRDKSFGISTEAKKRANADIPAPAVQPGADAWQKGDVVQVKLRKGAPKGK
jgi:hypothetical protein